MHLNAKHSHTMSSLFHGFISRVSDTFVVRNDADSVSLHIGLLRQVNFSPQLRNEEQVYSVKPIHL